MGEAEKKGPPDPEEAKVLPAREALSLIAGRRSEDDSDGESSDGDPGVDGTRADEPPPKTKT